MARHSPRGCRWGRASRSPPDRIAAVSEIPPIVLHGHPMSHPCRAVQEALNLKGLPFETQPVMPGPAMEAVYGEGRSTVPGLHIGDEQVHTSVVIMRRLEELVPEPALYPAGSETAIQAAEEWGDGELQDLGRRLSWGALRFRPQDSGSYRGHGELDPARIDRLLEFLPLTWAYHKITAVRLAEDLAGLPAILDEADGLITSGVIGGDEPNAADLQIGASLRVLTTIGDLEPMFDGRPSQELAHRWFPQWDGHVAAGAYPASWLAQ
jgi:glutathione S-transferase